MVALAESAATPTPTPVPVPVPVQGYVELAAGRRIVGWAWSPAAPEARLRIVLRHGDAVLDSGTADQPRADLAENGVGDGAHAFAFDLDPAWAGREGELDVAAIAPDGGETVLSAPPAPAAAPLRAGEDVRRLLQGIAASQRVLHRNLQALLLASRAREPLDAAIERVAATQQALDARTAELELFATRLDERLAALDHAQPGARRSPLVRIALAAALALACLGVLGVAVQFVP
ncbi:MAG: hypothetical protein IT556_19045 [Acetobacteraceae bacterium]|nr:hypothetical protein [Acetobacteraceae bacterium]